MTAIVAWQVFGRYVLNASPSWTEPAAIMVMSWFIFLGAAVGVRENYHLGFDVLLYVLPDGSKAVLRTISDLAVLAFGLGMVVYGCQLMRPDLDRDACRRSASAGRLRLPAARRRRRADRASSPLERLVLRLAGRRRRPRPPTPTRCRRSTT